MLISLKILKHRCFTDAINMSLMIGCNLVRSSYMRHTYYQDSAASPLQIHRNRSYTQSPIGQWINCSTGRPARSQQNQRGETEQLKCGTATIENQLKIIINILLMQCNQNLILHSSSNMYKIIIKI